MTDAPFDRDTAVPQCLRPVRCARGAHGDREARGGRRAGLPRGEHRRHRVRGDAGTPDRSEERGRPADREGPISRRPRGARRDGALRRVLLGNQRHVPGAADGGSDRAPRRGRPGLSAACPAGVEPVRLPRARHPSGNPPPQRRQPSRRQPRRDGPGAGVPDPKSDLDSVLELVIHNPLHPARTVSVSI